MSATEFRLVAVGDLQLGDSPTSVGFGFRSRYRSLAGVLDGIAAALGGADVVFGNLETPLSDRGVARNSLRSLQMRGDPSYARVLRAAGFTVLNVANNHAVQHGAEVFADSIAALRANGIAPCGIRGVAPWGSEPVILDVKGARIGVLGYCLRPRQYGAEEPPYAEGTPEGIRADVLRLREITDVVFVSLHWGEEFVQVPSIDEAALGRSLIDTGASVIIGHHPHVVRPVERRGNGVIAYSLGNCVGDMVWYPPFRRGALLAVRMTGDQVMSAQVQTTELDSSYRPSLAGTPQPPLTAEAVAPLDAAGYARAIARTWRAQRMAVYWYALLHIWRFPPRVVAQLVGRTIRNKVSGVLGRER